MMEGRYRGEPPDCDEAVRFLIHAGADVNAPGSGKRTPLAYAIAFNNVGAASQLLKAGANPDSVDLVETSALLLTLKQYADERYVHSLGRVPIFGPALPMIRLLLENHANPNVVAEGRYDEYNDARTIGYLAGYTPLTLAARHGWLDVAKLLLHHGADPALPRSDGLTAVVIAERYGHLQTASLIANYLRPSPANEVLYEYAP